MVWNASKACQTKERSYIDSDPNPDPERLVSRLVPQLNTNLKFLRASSAQVIDLDLIFGTYMDKGATKNYLINKNDYFVS